VKDETADVIAKELQLIREELQKLTNAVKSVASRPQTSTKSGGSNQGRNSLPFQPGPDRKPQAARRPEDKRRQWHLPTESK